MVERLTFVDTQDSIGTFVIMPNSVKLKTFESWHLNHIYDFEEVTVDGVTVVEKICCKICKRQLKNLKADHTACLRMIPLLASHSVRINTHR